MLTSCLLTAKIILAKTIRNDTSYVAIAAKQHNRIYAGGLIM
jgi:hypothetical protein